MEKIEIMVDYATRLIGAPYLWGGNGPHFDCSGFVQEVLASVGIDPRDDQTAQALYNHFEKFAEETLTRGSLLFYGASRDKITHVAIHLGEGCMIEAGGGDSSTTTLERANEQGAMVRIRPLRKNYVAVLDILT